MKNENINKCPVCSSQVEVIESIDGAMVLGGIMKIMPDLCMPNFLPKSYKLLQCEHCSLVFSHPMLAGDKHFYDWICRSRFYYPSVRWEWGPLIDVLKFRNAQRILDVGCGSGLFLTELRKNGLNGIGIDLNQSSIDACRDIGLTAVCMNIDEIESAGMPKFQAITLFHVLEHIENPASAISLLKANLVKDGIIALSVPLSPMSFETDWHDPLNRPPHHLSRWNAKSLRALADAVQMNSELIYQPSLSLWSRVLVTLQLKLNLPQIDGETKLFRAVKQAGRLLANPIISIKILVHQIKRDRLTNGSKGDAVLMIMSGRRI